MKVIAYLVLSIPPNELISDLVNRYLALGWQPWGGVAVSQTDGWFHQAMVKYEIKDDYL